MLPRKSQMTAASSFPPETRRVCVVSQDFTHVGCSHGDRGSACDVSQSEANANMLGARLWTTPITISINLNLGLNCMAAPSSTCWCPAGGDRYSDHWLCFKRRFMGLYFEFSWHKLQNGYCYDFVAYQIIIITVKASENWSQEKTAPHLNK